MKKLLFIPCFLVGCAHSPVDEHIKIYIECNNCIIIQAPPEEEDCSGDILNILPPLDQKSRYF